ncbi:hypothetical protein CBL_04295 [Carabus blaptoides fortunei]
MSKADTVDSQHDLKVENKNRSSYCGTQIWNHCSVQSLALAWFRAGSTERHLKPAHAYIRYGTRRAEIVKCRSQRKDLLMTGDEERAHQDGLHHVIGKRSFTRRQDGVVSAAAIVLDSQQSTTLSHQRSKKRECPKVKILQLKTRAI